MGAFVALGLIVAAVLVFIIGAERHMFQAKARLRANFNDVGGLRVGSPVRMGGIDVGAVESIEFGRNANDSQLHIEFTLVRASLVRVRRNSVVRVASKGLLGDKALDITIGDPRQPAVTDGALIPSDESPDVFTQAGGLVARASTVLDNIVAATRPLGNERLANDLMGLVHDLRTVTNQVATGNGTVSRLLRDDTVANQLQGTLASAESAVRNINGATAQLSGMIRDARNGRGLLHALIYDEQGGRAVQSLGRVADEVASITHDVRTGNGGLHEIIYGQDSANVIRNVDQATASVRDILRDIQRGRGTLGALLIDPSLYEDIRSLVSNVQRNEILRALVRYSIHADDRRGGVVRTSEGSSNGAGAQGTGSINGPDAGPPAN